MLTLCTVYRYAVANIQEYGKSPDPYLFVFVVWFQFFFVSIDRSRQELSIYYQICLYCGHIWISSVIRNKKKTTFYQDWKISGSVFFLFFVRFEFLWSQLIYLVKCYLNITKCVYVLGIYEYQMWFESKKKNFFYQNRKIPGFVFFLILVLF